MPKILAIDTSTDACSAALLLENDIISKFEVAPQQHTKLILPMIDVLLQQANMQLKDLHAIAFGCGPGSFTGVRLAASIVQGLAFGANLPVLKVSTLRVLAQGAWEKHAAKNVLVVQDARVNEVYYAAYRVGADGIMGAIDKDCLLKPEELIFPDATSNWYKIGTGWEAYKILQERCTFGNFISYNYPEAQYVAKLGAIDFANGKLFRPELALPVYLRDEVAWKKM